MSWILMEQIAALIALYVGGIFSVVHIVDKRVDDLNKNMSLRFDDFGNRINQRFDDFGKHIEHRFNDLRSQMSREHDTLAQKVDAIDRKLDAHISNYEIHNTSFTFPPCMWRRANASASSNVANDPQLMPERSTTSVYEPLSRR